MRPGSGALETSRANAASWRLRAERLSVEADGSKAKGKLDYERGLTDGREQYRQTLERLFREELT